MTLAPVSRPLERLMADLGAALETRWKRPDPVPTDAERRRRLAAELLREILPPGLAAPAPALAARIASPLFVRAATSWHFGDGNLVLVGHTSAGKTSAALLLLRRVVIGAAAAGGETWDKAQQSHFQPARELVRARFGDAPEAEKSKRAALTVLDDLGVDTDPTLVLHVLDARYSRGLPTIITSGLSPTQLKGAFGEAGFRRMVESGGRRGQIVSAFRKD